MAKLSLIGNLTALACVVVLVGACGVSDRSVQEQAQGGSTGGLSGGGGPIGGDGGAAPGGGSGGTAAGSDSEGGADSAGGSAGSGGSGGSGECLDGSRRCVDDTPEECQGKSWVSLEPCPVDAPACTNGVCALARVTGGLVTAQGNAAAGEFRLLDHGFEFQPRTCAEVAGEMVCATGGLKP